MQEYDSGLQVHSSLTRVTALSRAESSKNFLELSEQAGACRCLLSVLALVGMATCTGLSLSEAGCEGEAEMASAA